MVKRRKFLLITAFLILLISVSALSAYAATIWIKKDALSNKLKVGDININLSDDNGGEIRAFLFSGEIPQLDMKQDFIDYTSLKSAEADNEVVSKVVNLKRSGAELYYFFKPDAAVGSSSADKIFITCFDVTDPENIKLTSWNNIAISETEFIYGQIGNETAAVVSLELFIYYADTVIVPNQTVEFDLSLYTMLVSQVEVPEIEVSFDPDEIYMYKNDDLTFSSETLKFTVSGGEITASDGVKLIKTTTVLESVIYLSEENAGGETITGYKMGDTLNSILAGRYTVRVSAENNFGQNASAEKTINVKDVERITYRFNGDNEDVTTASSYNGGVINGIISDGERSVLSVASAAHTEGSGVRIAFNGGLEVNKLGSMNAVLKTSSQINIFAVDQNNALIDLEKTVSSSTYKSEKLLGSLKTKGITKLNALIFSSQDAGLTINIDEITTSGPEDSDVMFLNTVMTTENLSVHALNNGASEGSLSYVTLIGEYDDRESAATVGIGVIPSNTYPHIYYDAIIPALNPCYDYYEWRIYSPVADTKIELLSGYTLVQGWNTITLYWNDLYRSGVANAQRIYMLNVSVNNITMVLGSLTGFYFEPDAKFLDTVMTVDSLSVHAINNGASEGSLSYVLLRDVYADSQSTDTIGIGVTPTMTTPHIYYDALLSGTDPGYDYYDWRIYCSAAMTVQSANSHSLTKGWNMLRLTSTQLYRGGDANSQRLYITAGGSTGSVVMVLGSLKGGYTADVQFLDTVMTTRNLAVRAMAGASEGSLSYVPLTGAYADSLSTATMGIGVTPTMATPHIFYDTIISSEDPGYDYYEWRIYSYIDGMVVQFANNTTLSQGWNTIRLTWANLYRSGTVGAQRLYVTSGAGSYSGKVVMVLGSLTGHYN